MDLTVNVGGEEQATGQLFRASPWVAAAVGVLACLVSAASQWSMLQTNPIIGAINLMMVVSFVTTGVILQQEPGQRGTGVALVLAGVFYLVSWWWSWPPTWQVGPFPLVSFVCGYLWFVFGALALLRYPEPRVVRVSERTYIAALTSWIVAGKLLLAAVSVPAWLGYGDEAWWPSIAPDHGFFNTVDSVVNIGIVVLAGSVLPLLYLKVRRSRGIERIESVPVVVAATTVTVCGAAYLIARSGAFSPVIVDTLRAVIGASALFTPLAFLTTALQRRLARSSMADLIVKLVESPSATDVQQALRTSLSDPTLTVWFRLPRSEVYVDVVDRVATVPASVDRWPVPVENQRGERLAVLMLDPALQRHPKLVGPAVAACSFALENSRLHADRAAQLAEVRRSRARIAEAELAGRRELERNLHDGAQQILLAASASLGAARYRAQPGSAVRTAIEKAGRDLQQATDELRRLARGIHPPVLVQSGLRAALEGVAERLPINVTLSVLPDRLPSRVETTAYYVACEAMSNAARHAQATRIAVAVEQEADVMRMVVRDDGVGGARVGSGSGLTGIADRVSAIGGTLDIDSEEGAGTVIKVVLPCE